MGDSQALGNEKLNIKFTCNRHTSFPINLLFYDFSCTPNFEASMLVDPESLGRYEKYIFRHPGTSRVVASTGTANPAVMIKIKYHI
jgi:hypothetical protein